MGTESIHIGKESRWRIPSYTDLKYPLSISRRLNLPLHKGLLFFHDIVIIFFSLVFSFVIYIYFFNDGKSWNSLFVGGATILGTLMWFMAGKSLYKYQVILDRPRHVIALLKAMSYSLFILIFVSFVFKMEEVTASRVLIGTSYLTIAVVFMITRVAIAPAIYFWMVKTKRINRNMLIVGIGKESIERAKFLKNLENSNFDVVGFVDDGSIAENNLEDNESINVLGGIADLDAIVKDYKICDILVTSNYKREEKLHDIINQCNSTRRTIHIASDFYSIVNQKVQIEEIGMVSSFRFHPPRSLYIFSKFKRVVDLSASFAVIIFLMPLWLFIAALIKLSSPGAVFYKAKAIGKDGKEFAMYKFRSMRQGASTKLHEEKVIKMITANEATTKIQNDPRVTIIGRVLRKLSFDEFPQLINVIRGEMSLVGPRPCLPYEYSHMSDWQKKRFSVTPGMTGLWQIKGRDEVLFNDQVVLDLYYIEHRSVKLDVEILLSTIPVVIFGKGGG